MVYLTPTKAELGSAPAYLLKMIEFMGSNLTVIYLKMWIGGCTLYVGIAALYVVRLRSSFNLGRTKIVVACLS